ncbi:hypothetical protein [Sandarakinorhabdus oryzae]|uniref:hypothetical protein n=1 Tax=Sandarakinorhabdus oryzae TaxID=2675220 RepID=UPI0012E17619|nr:hypothetical protein [Sandarakinorhabdus oryzae]
MSVDPASWSAAERAAFMARREQRNKALAILLFALVALFFGITVVRMTGPQAKAPASMVAAP